MFLCHLALATSKPNDHNDFSTSAALYLTIPSLRALAEVVTTAIPGFIYLSKNITIGLHINLGFLFQFNLESIYGDKVYLENKMAVFNVTNKKYSSVRVGVTGWTTEISVYYNMKAFWGLIDIRGPMKVYIKDAGGLLTANFYETKKGYLFSLNLGDAWFNYDFLEINACKSCWFIDYLIKIYQFIIPVLGNAAMSGAISSANSMLSNILEKTNPEKIRIDLFSKSAIRIKPLESVKLNPKNETLTLMNACLQILDKKTDQPYYNWEIKSRPRYFENFPVPNQIFISDSLLSSLLKAISLDMPSLVEYNASDDSLNIILSEIPEIKTIIYTDEYKLKCGIANQTVIKTDKSMVHITGRIRVQVDAVDEGDGTLYPLVAFYPNVSLDLNLTISKYRMFLMIKNVEIHDTKWEILNKKLNITGNDKDITPILKMALIEESSILNGHFLLPFDLKTIQVIGYAAKYLRDGTLRFDVLDDYYILGFDTINS